MRFLLCKDELWYAGTTREGPQWTGKKEEAWDFATRPTAESILSRDRKLAGCEIVETR